MATDTRPSKLRGAYTLMEMMIVAAVLGLVMAYMMQTLTYQQQAYVITEQVTEAQQNLRLISDLLEREVRVAGYMVPPAAAACAADSTTAPDTLFVSAADKIRNVEDLETVDLNLVKGNLGAPVTVSGLLGADKNVVFSQTWVDVEADGMDFALGEGVILVDRNDPNGVVACGIIDTWPPACTASSTCNARIDFVANNFAAAGTDIVAVPAHVYRITPATPALPAQLFRDNDLMASDVEDLQVVFYYDRDGDRVVDTTPAGSEELFGASGMPVLPAPNTVDHSSIVEIRVNLVTVTRDDDPNQNFIGTRKQATANRAAFGAPDDDRRRRRIHQTTVRLRNLG